MSLLVLLVVLGFSRVGLGVRKPGARRARFPLVTAAALAVAVASLAALLWIAARALPAVSTAAAPNYLPFAASANVALAVLVLPALITWMAEYRLMRGHVRQSRALKERRESVDDIGLTVLWMGPVVGLAALFAVHLRFARLPGLVLLTDAVLLAVGLSCLLGLPLLGLFANSRVPPARRAGLLGLGLAQAVGHLCVPWLLVAFGAWKVGLLWVAAYAVLVAIACALARRGVRPPVIALWLAWVALPVIMVAVGTPHAQALNGWFLVAAGAVGAAASCAVLGSYLWTATLLGGHFNEAGGGARLERHRQILRFHVTSDGLEVFVLGIDRPALPRRADPTPTGEVRLVDRFKLPAR
jgi:hypothetical protein